MTDENLTVSYDQNLSAQELESSKAILLEAVKDFVDTAPATILSRQLDAEDINYMKDIISIVDGDETASLKSELLDGTPDQISEVQKMKNILTIMNGGEEDNRDTVLVIGNWQLLKNVNGTYYVENSSDATIYGDNLTYLDAAKGIVLTLAKGGADFHDFHRKLSLFFQMEREYAEMHERFNKSFQAFQTKYASTSKEINEMTEQTEELDLAALSKLAGLDDYQGVI